MRLLRHVRLLRRIRYIYVCYSKYNTNTIHMARGVTPCRHLRMIGLSSTTQVVDSTVSLTLVHPSPRRQCSKFYEAKLVKIYRYHVNNFHHGTQGGEDRDPCFSFPPLINVLENMFVCKDVYACPCNKFFLQIFGTLQYLHYYFI